MKKLITLLIISAISVVMARAANFADESLTYRVMYKWGLIHKQAGTATLTLKTTPEKYVAQLTAASEPWADKFYQVRDTLNGIMNPHSLHPVFYEKIAHEGSEDKHDTVNFHYQGNQVTGHCSRIEYKKGVLKKDQNQTLSATGAVVDMLSSFYYMRSLPFEKWKKGHKETVTIFSGKQKETLSFAYQGIEHIEVNGKRYQCFHITFIFTGNGGKKTSDNMDAWLTTGPRRLPVLLEGKLPVGKVKCELTATK